MPIKPYLCTLGVLPGSEPDPDELRAGNSAAILRVTLLSDAPHHVGEGKDESGDLWKTFASPCAEPCVLCSTWIHEGWYLFLQGPPMVLQYVCSSHVETRLPETPLLLMVDD